MADVQPAAAAPKEEEGEQSMIREAAIGKGTSPSNMLHCFFCCLCTAVLALYAAVLALYAAVHCSAMCTAPPHCVLIVKSPCFSCSATVPEAGLHASSGTVQLSSL